MTDEQYDFLDTLYRENQAKLLRYAKAVLENEELAMDVVQDTFHTAALRIDTVMTHENAPGWLMEVLKNKIKDHIRSRNRYIARFVSLDGLENHLAVEDEYNFSDGAATSVAAILSAIEQFLKPDDYYLLKRIILDGASHKEVAEELGITVWTSQKRLERIRGELETLFPEHCRRKKKKISKNILKIMSVFLFFGNT